jgi:hypothetical protein
MGPTALLPRGRKSSSAGCEPVNLGSNGKHTNHDHRGRLVRPTLLGLMTTRLCLRSEDAFVITCVANLMEVKSLVRSTGSAV